jgi:hypothetical protein
MFAGRATVAALLFKNPSMGMMSAFNVPQNPSNRPLEAPVMPVSPSVIKRNGVSKSWGTVANEAFRMSIGA